MDSGLPNQKKDSQQALPGFASLLRNRIGLSVALSGNQTQSMLERISRTPVHPPELAGSLAPQFVERFSGMIMERHPDIAAKFAVEAAASQEQETEDLVLSPPGQFMPVSWVDGESQDGLPGMPALPPGFERPSIEPSEQTPPPPTQTIMGREAVVRRAGIRPVSQVEEFTGTPPKPSISAERPKPRGPVPPAESPAFVQRQESSPAAEPLLASPPVEIGHEEPAAPLPETRLASPDAGMRPEELGLAPADVPVQAATTVQPAPERVRPAAEISNPADLVLARKTTRAAESPEGQVSASPEKVEQNRPQPAERKSQGGESQVAPSTPAPDSLQPADIPAQATPRPALFERDALEEVHSQESTSQAFQPGTDLPVTPEAAPPQQKPERQPGRPTQSELPLARKVQPGTQVETEKPGRISTAARKPPAISRQVEPVDAEESETAADSVRSQGTALETSPARDAGSSGELAQKKSSISEIPGQSTARQTPLPEPGLAAQSAEQLAGDNYTSDRSPDLVLARKLQVVQPDETQPPQSEAPASLQKSGEETIPAEVNGPGIELAAKIDRIQKESLPPLASAQNDLVLAPKSQPGEPERKARAETAAENLPEISRQVDSSQIGPESKLIEPPARGPKQDRIEPARVPTSEQPDLQAKPVEPPKIHQPDLVLASKPQLMKAEEPQLEASDQTGENPPTPEVKSTVADARISNLPPLVNRDMVTRQAEQVASREVETGGDSSIVPGEPPVESAPAEEQVQATPESFKTASKVEQSQSEVTAPETDSQSSQPELVLARKLQTSLEMADDEHPDTAPALNKPSRESPSLPDQPREGTSAASLKEPGEPAPQVVQQQAKTVQTQPDEISPAAVEPGPGSRPEPGLAGRPEIEQRPALVLARKVQPDLPAVPETASRQKAPDLNRPATPETRGASLLEPQASESAHPQSSPQNLIENASSEAEIARQVEPASPGESGSLPESELAQTGKLIRSSSQPEVPGRPEAGSEGQLPDLVLAPKAIPEGHPGPETVQAKKVPSQSEGVIPAEAASPEFTQKAMADLPEIVTKPAELHPADETIGQSGEIPGESTLVQMERRPADEAGKTSLVLARKTLPTSPEQPEPDSARIDAASHHDTIVGDLPSADINRQAEQSQSRLAPVEPAKAGAQELPGGETAPLVARSQVEPPAAMPVLVKPGRPQITEPQKLPLAARRLSTTSEEDSPIRMPSSALRTELEKGGPDLSPATDISAAISDRLSRKMVTRDLQTGLRNQILPPEPAGVLPQARYHGQPASDQVPEQKVTTEMPPAWQEQSPAFVHQGDMLQRKSVYDTANRTGQLPLARQVELRQESPDTMPGTSPTASTPVSPASERLPLAIQRTLETSSPAVLQRFVDEEEVGPDSEEQEVDLDKLAREVYPLIKRMLAIERERWASR